MDDESKRSASVSEPPLDPNAPPNLHLGLRDKPEVKALLEELNRGLRPGEDPLFYELPQAPPDDPEACAPDAARVYVPPTPPPRAHHKTLELDRVKVRASLVGRSSARSAGSDAAAREDAPAMSRPTVVSVRRGAGAASTRKPAAIGVAVVAAALIVIAAAALRSPRGAENSASASATTSIDARPSTHTMPNASATPSTNAMPSANANAMPSATAHVRVVEPRASAARGSEPRASASGSDPYDDVTPPIAKSAAPVPPQPTAVPKAPASAQPVAPPISTSGRILGGDE